MPSYVIFHDRSLQDMAIYYPQSRESFSAVYGVGSAKLNKYANEFLPIIVEYCQAGGIAEVPRARPKRVKDRPAGIRPRTLEVASMYNDGQNVAEIARSLGIKNSTVINHLWRYNQAGHSLRIDGFQSVSTLSPDERTEVLDCFQRLGADYLRPVYEALEESIPYEELHLQRLYYIASLSYHAGLIKDK